MGILGYFQKFIRNYADLIRPVRDTITQAELKAEMKKKKLTAR